MTQHKLIGLGQIAAIAACLAGGAALAAAREPAAAAPATVLDLGSSSSGSGKVSLQSFSWGVSQTPVRGSGRAAATSSVCPSSADTARWKAPELNSSGADSVLPSGAGCLEVKTARDAASGQATGRRKGWDGCVKGKHFEEVNLVHRDLAYRLTNVDVAECIADGMVLSFASAVSSRAPAGVTHEVH